MNNVILIGRLTKDPEVRYSTGENATAICRFTCAVPRNKKRDADGVNADFVPCVAFGQTAEFLSKYFHQGDPITVFGEVRTGNYTNKDGQKVYTTDINVKSLEFCISNSRNSGDGNNGSSRSNQYDKIEEELTGSGEKLPWEQ